MLPVLAVVALVATPAPVPLAIKSGIKFSAVGKYLQAFKPFHLKPAAADKPLVHKLRDLYQSDQQYADLFSSSGQSEICGPTAMSNLLLYLKAEHTPKFPRLFTHEGLPASPSDSQVVHKMFTLCHTNRDRGTNSVQLKGCSA